MGLGLGAAAGLTPGAGAGLAGFAVLDFLVVFFFFAFFFLVSVACFFAAGIACGAALLIGIADAAAGADTSGYPQLSAEYLVKSDPQVIFLADAQYGETALIVSKRAGWAGISAVKNNKIVELPADITSRWGPRLVDFYSVIGTALSKVSG